MGDPQQMCSLKFWNGIDIAHLGSALSGEEGLSRMCVEVFGARLDKSCQCSDWSQRPISPSQLQYAALDAWILLPLLHHLLGNSSNAKLFHSLSVSDAAVPFEAAAAKAVRFVGPSEHGVAGVMEALRKLQVDGHEACLVTSD